MSVNDLINQYKQAAAEEEAAKQQKMTDVLTRVTEFFTSNCQVWLSKVWDEIQVGEIEQFSHANFNNMSVTLRLPVHFLDIRGTLEQKVEIIEHGKYRWNSANLDFGYLDLNPKSHVWIDLKTDEKAQAIPPNPSSLGYVLSRVADYAPIYQAEKAKHEEYRRAEALEFQGSHIPHIQATMTRRIAELPDMEIQIREAAQKAVQDLEETERLRQEENQRYQEIIDERERLQAMADYAWRKPFDLYMVTYGAYLSDGEEGDIYSRSFYSFEDHAQEDGYWRALEAGKPSRRIKPLHVLSVELITVRSAREAPYEAKRGVELVSKTVEGASTIASIPPYEAFVFDMDEVIEEMAKEQ